MKLSQVVLPLGVVGAAVLAWFLIVGREAVDPVSGPKAGDFAPRLAPRQAIPGEVADEQISSVAGLTDYELYSGGVFLFDADVARQCGLSDIYLAQVRQLAFQFRMRLNEQIATRGTFTRLSDREMGIAFAGDELQADRMQREFSDFTISKLGEEKWRALVEIGIVAEITAKLDHFGQFDVDYVVAVTPHPHGGEDEVSIETISGRDRRIMLQNR